MENIATSSTYLQPQPVVLDGWNIRLEPLAENHIPGLLEAGQDPRIWRYLPYGNLQTYEAMEGWVREMIRRQASGTDLPFTAMLARSGTVIGATRYIDIRPQHRGLEIGGTWFSPNYWGSGVNTVCKYLLLKHAFEGLGCVRVQFRTDLRNEHSQHALERLGAVREGVLRNHIIMPDGYLRASVYYSIIADEWPQVKARLEANLKEATAF